MTDHRENRQMFSDNEEREFQQFRRLFVAAPSSTFSRFRKRANIHLGTRMLFESQIHGFWIVLDILLKRIFRVVRSSPNHYSARPDIRERG